MAELADALDSKSSARLGRVGSSPTSGIEEESRPATADSEQLEG